MENQSQEINKTRRRFLTLMLVGSGAFLAEKVFGPLFSRFFNDKTVKPIPTNEPGKSNIGNFQIVEHNKGLSIYDSSGEEIFQIDKDA